MTPKKANSSSKKKEKSLIEKVLGHLVVQAIILTIIVVIIATFGFNFLEYGVFGNLPPNPSGLFPFGTLDDSLWWAIITITTVGYGDVVPHNAVTQIFSMVIAIYGSGLMMMTSGLVASEFVARKFRAEREEEREKEKEERTGATEFDISGHFQQITNIKNIGLIGLTIAEASAKLQDEKNQVPIGYIRGKHLIFNPPEDEKLLAKDKLIIKELD